MDYLKIRNWKTFQHYKRRKPPWIKLHRDLLDNFEFSCLHDASRALAPMLWLLASEDEEGHIPADPEWIAFRVRQPVEWVVAALKPLIEGEFLMDASNALARCYQHAISETEAETEGEAETEPLTPSPLSPPDRGRDDDFDLDKALAFFGEPPVGSRARQRDPRWGEVAEVFEACLKLQDPPPLVLNGEEVRPGKPVWIVRAASTRKQCRERIMQRLKDGYTAGQLIRYAEVFVSLRRADRWYLARFGDRPRPGDPFWCPHPGWKIWELYGPQRFEKYADWCERTPLTEEDLERRRIGD